MVVQLPSTESGMMKVVSNTIISAIPSTPRVNRTPQVGIHTMSIGACHPVLAGSNDHQRPIETTNSSTNNQSATWRAAGVSTPAAVVAGSRTGSNSTITAPTSGIASSAGSTQRL